MIGLAWMAAGIAIGWVSCGIYLARPAAGRQPDHFCEICGVRSGMKITRREEATAGQIVARSVYLCGPCVAEDIEIHGETYE